MLFAISCLKFCANIGVKIKKLRVLNEELLRATYNTVSRNKEQSGGKR